MPGFWWGLAAGVSLSVLGAAVAGVAAYRRFVVLERRARDAERLAELGTLTGGLAHEIKNPLSTVQLNLQLLQEDLHDLSPPARISSRLETVRREAGRLRDILDSFMRYAGRLELDRRDCDLNTLLEELADFYAPQAQLQQVNLRLQKHPAPLVASVDPVLVKQTLLNLMVNALHAMPAGGDLILSARPDGRFALLQVVDTGSGIAPEAVEKIFRPYYSTKKGGAGLGLAMSRRIAEAHGGGLSVCSDLGKGSSFALRLPLG